MQFDFGNLTGFVMAFTLYLCRAGGFMTVVPLFGRARDSVHFRIILAIAMATIFFWTGRTHFPLPSHVLEMAVLAGREAFIGLALGFGVSLISHVLTATGEIVSNEMGFSMARAMDPETGADAAVMSQLLSMLGLVMMLQLNLHHEALRILGDTFRAVPIGGTFEFEPVWLALKTLVSGSILLALQYAFPVLAVMLLLTAAFVVLGRAVPNINLMEFSFAARILLALVAAAWFLIEGAPFMAQSFASMLQGTRDMFPV